MKTLFIAIAAAGLTLATGAFAQDAAAAPDFTKVDADANGSVSLAEAQTVWPNLTQEDFTKADTNGDGSLDSAEFTAYVATLGGASTSSQ